MRRRLVITSTVLCIVFCLSMLVYSVYAHLNQSFSVSNTIGFVASDAIYVGLDCSVSGCKQMQDTQIPDGYANLDEYRYDKGFLNKVDFDESVRGTEQVLGDWRIKESLLFVDMSTPIVYTITVYNYSQMSIRVTISDYVTSSKNFTNSVSNSVIIDAYNFDNNPSSGTVTLQTSVATNVSGGFEDASNNFNITIETI